MSPTRGAWEIFRPGPSRPGEPADLLADAYRAAPRDLSVVLGQHVEALGCREATVYLVDLQQSTLVPLTERYRSPVATHLEPLAVESTLAGRCYQTQEPVAHDEDGTESKLWLPLRRGSERLGVASFLVPPEVVEDDHAVLRLTDLLAQVAHLLTVRAPYVDSLVNLRRRGPMGLAAEMQWSLLPPLTFVGDTVTVSGVLEPAYDVAGDSVDYTIDDDGVQLGIFDCMGHELHSAQTAVLTVNAYRNARRGGRNLVDIARAVDRSLDAVLGGDAFATAVLALLDPDSGLFSWVNAGHPEPLLFRANRLVRALEVDPSPPLGTWAALGMADHQMRRGTEQLEPGDMVLLYTDGVTEARAPDGSMYGLDRLVETVTRHLAGSLPAPESMRRVTASLMDYQQDQLTDDATLMLVQWHPAAADDA